MAAYRPATPPLMLRLSRNWAFQLGVVGVVAFVGFNLIRAKNRAQLVETFSAFEQAATRRTPTQNQFLSKNPNANIAANINSTTVQRPTHQVPESGANPAANTASTNAGSPSNSGAPGVASLASPPSVQTGVSRIAESLVGDTNPLPTKLKLVFAELTRTSLAALVNDSRSIASFGTYFAGIIPDREEKIKIDASTLGINILDTAGDLQLKLNQPIVLFKGSRDPVLDQNIGLTTQITPTVIDELGAHLQIEVKRSMRAPAGTIPAIQEETFQEQIILKKDARAYLSGLLPHRPLSEEETRNLNSNSTILKVLASPDFQSGNSEFVVFVEAK
jgi:hypothetical protein